MKNFVERTEHPCEHLHHVEFTDRGAMADSVRPSTPRLPAITCNFAAISTGSFRIACQLTVPIACKLMVQHLS